MASNPRPTYRQLQRTVAELAHEKTIADRLVQVAEKQISQLRAQLAASQAPPSALKVPLKVVAYNVGLRPERLRRWCIAGIVDAELIGHQWYVSEASLADYMRRIGLVACPHQSKTATISRGE